MSRHEKLISIYSQVLASLNVVDDGTGLLNRQIGDQTVPLTCDNLRVVLPTREVLQTLDPKTQMAFHPLCESAVRGGESPVIRLLRTLINHRTTMVLLELMNQLLAIAMDNKRHSLLSPAQKEFLTHVPDISPDCHKEFSDIAKIIKPNEREKAANIYLKRAPTLRDTLYKRGGIVNFPLLEELRSKGDRVYSKHIKVRNKKILSALMGYILDDDGESKLAGVRMSYGTSGTTAPNFDALIHAYANIMSRLEVVTELFKEHLPSYDLIRVDMSWVSLLDDLTVFKGIIPSLPGNEGSVNEGAVDENDGVVVNQPITQQQPVHNVQAPKAAPVKRSLAAPLYDSGQPVVASESNATPERNISTTPVHSASRVFSPAGDPYAAQEWSNARRNPQEPYSRQSPRGGYVQERQNNVQTSRFNQAITQRASVSRGYDDYDVPLSDGSTTRMAIPNEHSGRSTVAGSRFNTQPTNSFSGRGRGGTPFGI